MTSRVQVRRGSGNEPQWKSLAIGQMNGQYVSQWSLPWILIQRSLDVHPELIPVQHSGSQIVHSWDGPINHCRRVRNPIRGFNGASSDLTGMLFQYVSVNFWCTGLCFLFFKPIFTFIIIKNI